MWSYKNDYATFEGTIEQAILAFPDVDFSGLNTKFGLRRTKEVDPNIEIPPNFPLTWHPLNKFDVDENNGKPTNWDSYLNATQIAIDGIGLIPLVGDVADIINGTISLARGNYGDAALSFAATIPFVGTVAGIGKILKKVTKLVDNKGVYDLMVRNGNDIKGYVGHSSDVPNRIANHFKKNGKLKNTISEVPEIIYKMPKSTKLERDINEQFVIYRKYGMEINPDKNPVAKLLNKVNPVGGRYDLKSQKGIKEFLKKAEEVAKKYKLPTTFDPL